MGGVSTFYRLPLAETVFLFLFHFGEMNDRLTPPSVFYFCPLRRFTLSICLSFHKTESEGKWAKIY